MLEDDLEDFRMEDDQKDGRKIDGNPKARKRRKFEIVEGWGEAVNVMECEFVQLAGIPPYLPMEQRQNCRLRGSRRCIGRSRDIEAGPWLPGNIRSV